MGEETQSSHWKVQARVKTHRKIVSGINAWSLSVSTVLFDGLGRGGIDHAAYADLSPISKQRTRILLFFWQTLLELGPSGFEVLPRYVSGTLPFSSERLALSGRWVSGYCKSYEAVRRLILTCYRRLLLDAGTYVNRLDSNFSNRVPSISFPKNKYIFC